MPTSGKVLATLLIDPELILGVSFFMEKAPWSISSSLRMKVLDYNRSTFSSKILEL